MRSFFGALPQHCIYISKRAKPPNQTTSLKNSVISLLKPVHAPPNPVFTIKKDLLKTDWALNSKKKATKKQQTPPLTMCPQQHHEYSPAVVAEAMVFVAKIGATVAAATGVPVLKMVFYEKKFLRLEDHCI